MYLYHSSIFEIHLTCNGKDTMRVGPKHLLPCCRFRFWYFVSATQEQMSLHLAVEILIAGSHPEDDPVKKTTLGKQRQRVVTRMSQDLQISYTD